MTRAIVIIPTYNEKENVERMARAVMSLAVSIDILFVDDNSPDGTAGIIRSLMTEFPNRIFLEEREDGPFRIMLYQLEGFYVEVYFFKRYNKVAFFKAFSNTADLQPYLQQIDVAELLNEVFS